MHLAFLIRCVQSAGAILVASQCTAFLVYCSHGRTKEAIGPFQFEQDRKALDIENLSTHQLLQSDMPSYSQTCLWRLKACCSQFARPWTIWSFEAERGFALNVVAFICVPPEPRFCHRCRPWLRNTRHAPEADSHTRLRQLVGIACFFLRVRQGCYFVVTPGFPFHKGFFKSLTSHFIDTISL